MSLNSKVVWSDGMFLSPDHFRLHDRYIESLVQGRAAGMRSFDWGFAHLVLDTEELGRGLVAVTECSGVFPDGSPFDAGPADAPPAPLAVSGEVRDTDVVLALPKYRSGTDEVGLAESVGGLSRYVLNHESAQGEAQVLADEDDIEVETARPRLRLLLAGDDTSAYAVIGVAHIDEVRPDGQVVLDPAYIPPCLDIRASARLQGFVKELVGHLRQKAQTMAGRMADPKGGASEIADFIFLMVLNRHEPWFTHLADASGIGPESCYQAMVHAAGELATITRDDKRPLPAPAYVQDDLASTFEPLMAELRRSIQWVGEQRAIPIAVEKFKYGMWSAQINDRNLITGADFVLTVNANMPGKKLVVEFANKTTVGPESVIRDLVIGHLTGIGLQHLAAAPRQIPFYKGAAYFALDHSSKHWKALEESGGLAFHVAGEFPELEMELWAVRG